MFLTIAMNGPNDRIHTVTTRAPSNRNLSTLNCRNEGVSTAEELKRNRERKGGRGREKERERGREKRRKRRKERRKGRDKDKYMYTHDYMYMYVRVYMKLVNLFCVDPQK